LLSVYFNLGNQWLALAYLDAVAINTSRHAFALYLAPQVTLFIAVEITFVAALLYEGILASLVEYNGERLFLIAAAFRHGPLHLLFLAGTDTALAFIAVATAFGCVILAIVVIAFE